MAKKTYLILSVCILIVSVLALIANALTLAMVVDYNAREQQRKAGEAGVDQPAGDALDDIQKEPKGWRSNAPPKLLIGA